MVQGLRTIDRSYRVLSTVCGLCRKCGVEGYFMSFWGLIYVNSSLWLRNVCIRAMFILMEANSRYAALCLPLELDKVWFHFIEKYVEEI